MDPEDQINVPALAKIIDWARREMINVERQNKMYQIENHPTSSTLGMIRLGARNTQQTKQNFEEKTKRNYNNSILWKNNADTQEGEGQNNTRDQENDFVKFTARLKRYIADRDGNTMKS